MFTLVPRINKARLVSRITVTMMAAVLVAACSSPPQPSVTSVSVTAPSEMVVGETAQATAVVDVVNGASAGVVWSSSDEAVAIVSTGGLIGALADGAVNVTATSQHDPTKSDSVSVTVNPPPIVTSVTVSAPSEIMAGRDAQATVVVEVANGAGDAVVWSSSDEAVATVSAGGLISALADGSVDIAATSQDDPTKSDSVTLAVLNPLRDATVLYYSDFLVGTDAALAALTEAAALYGAVVVVTDDLNFVTDLGSESPDLVVYLRQGNSGIPDEAEGPLVDWVDNGGALVFATFLFAAADVVTMLAAMEAELTLNANFVSMEIEDSAIAEGLSGTTMPIVNPGWADFSTGLQATGDGVELAHFYDNTPELTTDAALVSGNEGRTMALGFLVDTVEGTDGVNLLRNVFEYVLRAALP